MCYKNATSAFRIANSLFNFLFTFFFSFASIHRRCPTPSATATLLNSSDSSHHRDHL